MKSGERVRRARRNFGRMPRAREGEGRDGLIGVGVFGLGYMGRFEARVLRNHPRARLVAVASRSIDNARRLAAELGCSACPDLKTLLNHSGMDAVVVATPNNLHVEAVVEALRRGKHVFVEKPMALSAVDCDRMIAGAEAVGARLMVGHVMRFYEGMLRTKRLVASGAIGHPLVVQAERTGWEPRATSLTWKKIQSQSGGQLFHHIHEIDLLLWFLGDVEEVSCYAGNLAHQGPGCGDQDDVLVLTLRFRSGAIGSMHLGSAFRFGDHVLRISGERGGVEVSQRAATVRLVREGYPDRTGPLFADEESQESIIGLFKRKDLAIAHGSPSDDPPLYLARHLERALDAWVGAVLGEPVPDHLQEVMDGSAGRAAVEVAEAALQSARAGRPVRLPLR